MRLNQLRSLPPGLKTDPVALPRYLKGGAEAVLLVHGYTGITDELLYFAQALHGAGYTVKLPRLSGHGTAEQDFLDCRAEDWVRDCVNAYADLRAEHSTVHWVGLSMGALLAILGMSQFHSGKLVLAAPALEVFDSRIALTPLLKLFVRKIPKPDYVFDGPAPYGNIAQTYWRYNWPTQAAELLKLQKVARQALPLLREKILVLLGGKDETVPPTVADLVKQKVVHGQVESRVFTQSGHVVLNGPEKEEVAKTVIDWLSQG